MTRSNLIFVVDEEFPKLGIKDNSLAALWLTPFWGRIFACANGKLYTAGLERLPSIFKKNPIRCDTLQTLDFTKNNYADYLAAPLDQDKACLFIKNRSRVYRLYAKAVKMVKKTVGIP